MLTRDRPQLAQILLAMAREGLGELAWILAPRAHDSRALPLLDGFSDEMGNRRALDRPLLTLVLGADPGSPALQRTRDPAAELWWKVARNDAAAAIDLVDGSGALFPSLREEGIESWTESELAGLHALSIAAAQAEQHHEKERAAALRARCDAAARFLMDELQPDNATNRPWAVHVFLSMWSEADDVAARMYAETLLNNCQVLYGRADRLSAVILASAASSLAQGK